MEISFATEALKEACLARELHANDLPREVIGALHILYNAMRNAEHVGELPFGQPQPGKLIAGSEWRSDLVNGYTVVIRVNHAKLPLNHHGIDWTRVYRVQVMAIEAPRA